MLACTHRLQVAATDLLGDAHWRIMPGERWGLVGANGAGKSTLLKVQQHADATVGMDAYDLNLSETSCILVPLQALCGIRPVRPAALGALFPGRNRGTDVRYTTICSFCQGPQCSAAQVDAGQVRVAPSVQVGWLPQVHSGELCSM